MSEFHCHLQSFRGSFHTALMMPQFMCAREVDGIFKVQLSAMNGVRARAYEFKKVTVADTSMTYTTAMIKQCKIYGMKPVWYVCVW